MDDFEENVIDEEYSDDSLLNLISYGADLSVRELVNMFEVGELVKPSLQRNYVWDKKMASRFIDSILLGLPVPSIFLAKDESERLLIVDGLQRITTVADFFCEIFSKTGKKFKLYNGEIINEKWRNKTFSELAPEYQRRIKNYTLHAIIFERKTNNASDTAMYQIFERINTGGRILSPQEIRNCVYHGEFNNLLIELNKNGKWRELYGANLDERMKDVELILRFFALSNVFNRNEKISNLNKYLNLFMKEKQHILLNEEEAFVTEFQKTVDFIYDNFRGTLGAKKTPLKKRVGKTLLLESLMISTNIYLRNQPFYSSVNDAEFFTRKVDELLNDELYFEASNSRTTDVSNIKTRLLRCLEIIYGIQM